MQMMFHRLAKSFFDIITDMKMRIGLALAATAVVAGVLGARAECTTPRI